MPLAIAPLSSAALDPITHTLLGASLAHVVFGRRLGRAAALAGGLAAFAPDADVFLHDAADPLFAIAHHRGFTHSLAFAPVGAAVVAALFLLRPVWRDRGRWPALWAAATLAWLSHALLDAATTYGTQLLWPFSPTRAGWDLIAIVDPVFTLALLIGLVVAIVRNTARPAAVALAFGAAYLVLGGVQHARAVGAQRELAARRGHAPVRVEVMPTLANNLVWRALYEHDGRIFSDRIRVGWFSGATVREGWSLPLLRAAGLTPAEAARDRRRSFARFAWFSDDWVARSPADPALVADMRYTLSTEAFDPIWGIRFTAEGANTEVEWLNRARDRRIDLSGTWREITGADERFRPLP
ncbi:MAG: metal-dependent hydrolase [Opitutaceae bacterium]|nr:metal-dependent hydrolase [Opitutaceae bacterium]